MKTGTQMIQQLSDRQRLRDAGWYTTWNEYTWVAPHMNSSNCNIDWAGVPTEEAIRQLDKKSQ